MLFISFILKALFISQDISIFVLTFWSCRKNSCWEEAGTWSPGLGGSNLKGETLFIIPCIKRGNDK